MYFIYATQGIHHLNRLTFIALRAITKESRGNWCVFKRRVLKQQEKHDTMLPSDVHFSDFQVLQPKNSNTILSEKDEHSITLSTSLFLYPLPA